MLKSEVTSEEIDPKILKKWEKLGLVHSSVATYNKYIYEGKAVVTFKSVIELCHPKDQKNSALERHTTGFSGDEIMKIFDIFHQAATELTKVGGSTSFIETSIVNYGGAAFAVIESHPASMIYADAIAENFAFLNSAICDSLYKASLFETVTDQDSLIDIKHPIIDGWDTTRETPKMSYERYKKLRK